MPALWRQCWWLLVTRLCHKSTALVHTWFSSTKTAAKHLPHFFIPDAILSHAVNAVTQTLTIKLASSCFTRSSLVELACKRKMVWYSHFLWRAVPWACYTRHYCLPSHTDVEIEIPTPLENQSIARGCSETPQA